MNSAQVHAIIQLCSNGIYIITDGRVVEVRRGVRATMERGMDRLVEPGPMEEANMVPWRLGSSGRPPNIGVVGLCWGQLLARCWGQQHQQKVREKLSYVAMLVSVPALSCSSLSLRHVEQDFGVANFTPSEPVISLADQ